MVEVESNEDGGLNEDEFQDMLDNLDIYQGALDRCNLTIQKYNDSIK